MAHPEQPDADLLLPVPWETRNLGVPSFAVADEVLAGSNWARLEPALAKLKLSHPTLFVQARVPHRFGHVAQSLCRLGFYPVETTLDPVANLSRNPRLKSFLNTPEDVLPRNIGAGEVAVRAVFDLAGMREELAPMARESFSNSRFHVDPNCPASVASERYVHWMREMLSGNPEVSLDVLYLHDKPAGFFICKGNYLALAGFSPAHTGAGLGEYLWLSTLARLYAAGIDAVRSRISVANTPVLNLYVRLGFKFRDPALVFHYWAAGPRSPGV